MHFILCLRICLHVCKWKYVCICIYGFLEVYQDEVHQHFSGIFKLIFTGYIFRITYYIKHYISLQLYSFLRYNFLKLELLLIT